MTILDDALSLFGLKIEQRRNSPPPGVRYVDSYDMIANIFAAARQQSNSVFFSLGRRRRRHREQRRRSWRRPHAAAR